MGPAISAVGTGTIGEALADRPEAALVIGVRRKAGLLVAGPGSAVAEKVLGASVVTIAGAALPATGRPLETATVAVPRGAGAADGREVRPGGLVRRVVIVDLGELPDGAAPEPGIIFGAALASSRGLAGDVVSLLALETADETGAGLVAEGHAAGRWRYSRSAARDEGEIIVATEVEVSDDLLLRARLASGAVAWVRSVVEAPPNQLGPQEFADAVVAYSDRVAGGAVTVDIWDAAALAARGFGGTLGVGAGSARPPLVVELRTDGVGPVTALAGKGITFDSGGLNLKRDPGEIAWMKADMAAAAAVAAAVITSAALGRAGALHAVLPVAENMPGGGAQRPGDVVQHPDGRTTEVVDTDSEGRLVLADALAWLAAERPARLIDVGTLTDSGAVGTAFWGCWGTSEVLARELLTAGRAVADPGWLLPLHDSYSVLLESRVADVANCSAAAPDTGQLAATYLRTFTADVPWLHIDNGSSAWLERDTPSWPAGPTATPVRALIEMLSPAGA